MLLKLRHDGLDSGRVDPYKSVVTAHLVTYENGSTARLVPYLVILRIIQAGLSTIFLEMSCMRGSYVADK